MIDMDTLRVTLKDAEQIVNELDGLEFDDRDAVTADKATRAKRQEQALRSKTLLLLAHRLELAKALVMVEYYFARGEIDPLDLERRLES